MRSKLVLITVFMPSSHCWIEVSDEVVNNIAQCNYHRISGTRNPCEEYFCFDHRDFTQCHVNCLR